MAYPKHGSFDRILAALKEGTAPKQIARDLDVPHPTVLSIKNRYIDTVYVLKRQPPDRNQMWFPFIQNPNPGRKRA